MLPEILLVNWITPSIPITESPLLLSDTTAAADDGADDGDDFAAGCAYYGVTAAVAMACEGAGGPATVEESIAMGLGVMTCTDIGASYDAACFGRV